MEAVQERQSISYQLVFMGNDEWGSELMKKAADEAFAASPDDPDMVVEVHEHAGWFLSFLRDGTIVGTANDQAALSPKARQWWHKFNTSPTNVLPTIRRP